VAESSRFQCPEAQPDGWLRNLVRQFAANVLSTSAPVPAPRQQPASLQPQAPAPVHVAHNDSSLAGVGFDWESLMALDQDVGQSFGVARVGSSSDSGYQSGLRQ
jgi:hypothetical protein